MINNDIMDEDYGKEMKPKKELNNTQRKILETIYIRRLDNRKRDVTQARRTELEEFTKQVEEDIKQSKEYLAVNKAVENLANVIEKHLPAIRENGLHVAGLGSYRNNDIERVRDIKVEMNSYGNDNPRIEKFKAETNDISTKFQTAEETIRMKIWGMDATYEDIEKEVESVLESIK